MEVVNDLLNYNKLKIVQNTDWFKFSLDSVLLANFVHARPNDKIMDFCTGNAPIPLFLQHKVKNKILGVEYQKEIYELAIKSVCINNLEDKIEIINDDVKNISNIYETDSFDIITCNPPYFKVNDNAKINDNDIKSVARHEIKLNLNDIFSCAKKILKNGGSIYMVHRTERLLEILNIMQKNNIMPKRICFIYPFEDADSNMVLIEGRKNGNLGMKITKPIIVHEKSGEYTKFINDIFDGGLEI